MEQWAFTPPSSILAMSFSTTSANNSESTRFRYYASGLGFGRRTGIDLPSEEPGLVPSEEWVERVYHHKWYAGETISVSVGQGAVTVTPIQLARMAAAVASGGTLVQPHLLKSYPNPKVDHFRPQRQHRGTGHPGALWCRE